MYRRKSLRAWIRENRAEIDQAIDRALGRTSVDPGRRNDEERRSWVLNDEGLYRWARSERVAV